ncbi:acyltransferase [Candidatus Planktophila dulcis]|uniref:Acyltransferase n=1 Tax=Candidatus Planktophila dulcis TaxID=1884914 RepID=A0AAC9YSQ8_9ACTN|nr:acyltransferase [Candidatus Planktophila dulcis]ASY11475.1 acyltransferase [Candidatus Planktophila dulcis]
MTEIARNRSLGLDLARTIAIVAVVWVHTTGIQAGAFGVQLFFLISGYLLADYQKHYSSSEFLLNRFLRLFPLAIGMTLAFNFRFDSSLEFVTSLLLLNGFFTAITSFPGGWSISSEWIYSWFNLFLVRLKMKTKLALISFLIVLGLLMDLRNYLQPNAWAFSNLSIYLLVFFSYFLIGNILKTRNQHLKVGIARSRTFLLMALVPLFTINFQLPQIFYVLLLTTVFISCLEQEIYNERLIKAIHFLGKRTYGTFCGHFIVLIGIQNIDPNNQIHNYLSSFAEVVTFLIVLAGGLILGTFSYKFIERPIIHKSHYYISNRRLNKL